MAGAGDKKGGGGSIKKGATRKIKNEAEPHTFLGGGSGGRKRVRRYAAHCESKKGGALK